MFHQLVSHNEDLRRMMEKGYAFSIDGGYLIVRDIPYLNAQKELQWGAFVAKLEFIDKLTVTQDDHQIWFTGSVPRGLDGKLIPNLGGVRPPWRWAKPVKTLSSSGDFQTNLRVGSLLILVIRWIAI